MKRALSVIFALMFVWLIANPAMVTNSAAAGVAVTSVKLNSTSLLWAIGMTGKFSVSVSPSNATNKSVSWKSGNSKIVTVSSTGVINTVGIGKTTITCTSKSNPSKKSVCTVTVTYGKAIASLKLSASTLKWPVGLSGKFSVYILPSDTKNRAVAWKSSNTSVATVDNAGNVKAVRTGKATITCTSMANTSKKATCSVTVGKSVTSVKLNIYTLKWPVGKSGKFTVTVAPNDAVNKAVVWKSSNNAVATVSSAGVVFAKSLGNATLTCTARYNSKIKATCKISVTAAEGGAVVSYKYNEDEGFFYVEDNPWQRSFGFNRLYDWGAPITAMYYNTVRLQFTYNKLDWMIQLWKGQYGYAFIGSEIGIYTRDEKFASGTLDHYNCADDNHRLMMNMALYNKDKWLFTRTYQLYWWATGFMPGSLDRYADRTQLTMVSKITLNNATMTKAFVEAMLKNGFTYAAKAGKTTPDTFTIRGNDVYFNWARIGQPGVTSNIVFYADGGTETLPLKGVVGEKLIPPADPTKDGVAFAGWNPELPETYPKDGLTVTAQWAAPSTITFDSNGGSAVAPLDGVVGVAVTAPANPTKANNTFDGWDPALPAKFPTGGLTVKAKWKVNQSTITFNSDGGSAVAPKTGDFGSAVTAPTAPTKTGYSFAGWSPSLPATFPATGITVKATWSAGSKIIFNTDGGSSIASITRNAGEALTAPANPTKTGYTFTAWSPTLPAKFPEGGLTVTAQWKAIQTTVTFNSDGGTSVSAKTGDYDTTFDKPSDPTKTGFVFVSWDPALPAKYPLNDLIVKATWAAESTITFNSDGGSAVASKTGGVGLTLAAPAAPTKTGYTFAGWTPTLPANYPAGGLTVTATWTIKQITITFNSSGGTAVGSITGNYGTAVTAPTAPTKTGYDFAGWDPTLPTIFPAEGLYVRALWTPVVTTTAP